MIGVESLIRVPANEETPGEGLGPMLGWEYFEGVNHEYLEAKRHR